MVPTGPNNENNQSKPGHPEPLVLAGDSVVQTSASVAQDGPGLVAEIGLNAMAVISNISDESLQGAGGHYELYSERFSCAVREALEAASPADRPGLEAAAAAHGDYDPRLGVDYTWRFEPEEQELTLLWLTEPDAVPGVEKVLPAQESLLSALQGLSEVALAETKTMPELKPITKRTDWDMCEDGTLQDLIFDTLTLHDVLEVLGPMAEALARRVKADEGAGVAVPPLDTRVLQTYRSLLADNIPAADKLRNWNSR